MGKISSASLLTVVRRIVVVVLAGLYFQKR